MSAYDRLRKDQITLMILRRNLRRLCATIKYEVTKAEVEWMNLSALSKNLSKKGAKGKLKLQTPGSAPKKVDVANTLDLPQMDLPTLNLNPHIANVAQLSNLDEEFDSD